MRWYVRKLIGDGVVGVDGADLCEREGREGGDGRDEHIALEVLQHLRQVDALQPGRLQRLVNERRPADEEDGGHGRGVGRRGEEGESPRE